MERFKTIIFSKPYLFSFLAIIYNFNSIFRIHCSPGNELKYSKAFLKRTRIQVKKKNNTILIMNGSYLNNCIIAIYGRNNKVVINENCRMKDVEIHVEDDNNEIIIGKGTTIAGFTHLACIEGTKIKIGDDCMFSKGITFRTGDSHSIIDETGNRVNPSKDIIIGNHVWVGNTVILTKGAIVSDNCIIGTGSIVTKAFEKSNIIIAGSPAKIVKEGINWLRKRI